MSNQYSEQDCLDSLRLAAEELDRAPTQSEYSTMGLSPSTSVIKHRCGTWDQALEKIGFEKPTRRQYTKEDCLRSIRYVAHEINGEPTIGDYKRSGYRPSPTTIGEICGSWTEAKEMADVIEKDNSEDEDEKSVRAEVREEFDRILGESPSEGQYE